MRKVTCGKLLAMRTWALVGDVLEIGGNSGHLPATVDEVYASIVEGNPFRDDLKPGKVGAAKLLRFSPYPVDLFIALKPTEDNGWPSFQYEARTQQAECFPVSEAAVERGHVVHEGTWYALASGAGEELQAILERTGIGVGTDGLKPFIELKKLAIEGAPVVDRLPDGALKRHAFRSSSCDTGSPVGILATLYPYQVDGWQWLRFILAEQFGGLLADEMGLGKTLQVISALRDPGSENPIAASLVVAPGSLLENWVREIRKFCPEFSVLKHQGRMRTGRPLDLSDYNVVVVSYDTVIRDLSLLKMIKWNVVILDEAQNIRNPDALRTRSVKEIDRQVGLAVTGTPVENRLRDLWSIIDFVVPGYLGELGDFETRYLDNEEAASDLETIVSPLILRRRVADVAKDLPARIDIPEYLEMTDAEVTGYEAIRQAIHDEYGTAAKLVELGRLRQFCAHPSILGESVGQMSGSMDFTKMLRLKGLLEEVFMRDEKALVFTSYTAMSDLIAAMASREFGVMADTLDGRVPIGDRQPLLDRFARHPGAAVLALNPKAGGSGLNITAANHVIHYNPEWNPALEDQASARAHRRGQTRPVTVHRMIFAGTVEEVMDERLMRKRSVAENAIVGVKGEEEDYDDILSALTRSPLST